MIELAEEIFKNIQLQQHYKPKQRITIMKFSSASSIIFLAALLGLVQAKDANEVTRDASPPMPMQKESRQDTIYMMDENESMGMDTLGQYGGEIPMYEIDGVDMSMEETQFGQGRYFTQEDIDSMVQQGEVDGYSEGELYSNDLDMGVDVGMDGTEETQFGPETYLTQEDIDLMVEMDEIYEGEMYTNEMDMGMNMESEEHYSNPNELP